MATRKTETPAILYSLLLLWVATALLYSADRCPFDSEKQGFIGTPLEQARCLLRPVQKFGNLGDTPDSLPAPLEKLVGQPFQISKAKILQYLKNHRIPEKQIGGSLSEPVSRANNNDPRAPYAQYFLIHDTSTPNYLEKPFPQNINEATWKHNKLSRWDMGRKAKAHVFINRLGESLTAVDFKTPWRATKMELEILKRKGKGLCLHVEMIQPRRSDPEAFSGNDAIAPQPGFTPAQIQRLALVYLTASARRGQWMIPAFHAAFDAGISGAHDDPQNFDLPLWANSLAALLGEIQDIQVSDEGRE